MTTPHKGDFAPPNEAAHFYIGEVMHHRMKPVTHRFAYQVFTILVDLAKLNEAGRTSPFFSVNRFNLMSFYEKDHGPRDGCALFPYAQKLLADAGVDLGAEGRILLLCYPRILGYVFNPLSTYFAYASDGTLKAILYEVSNTFGEKHTYVAPIDQGDASDAGIRQEREKLFYVSPFNSLAMKYAFRIRPPSDEIAVRILATDDDGPLMAATFHGVHRTLKSATILRLFLTMPLLTIKIIVGIHYEALILFLKGLRMVERPKPPSLASFPHKKDG